MDSRDERRGRVLVEGLALRGGPMDLAGLRDFVPNEWVHRSAVGFDGVLRILPEPLTDRLPADVADLLEPLADAFARQRLEVPAALDALEAAHRLAAVVEATVLHATGELAARTGEEQLKLKDVTDPAELSRTARERWRGRCKAIAGFETSALTGAGRGRAREQVAIALAPKASRAALDQALNAGIARMELVTAWWRRCSRMPHEQAAVVARALFATDADPTEAAVERLTPEGELSGRPWAKKEFEQALQREALRQEAADPDAQERQRRSGHKRRDAYAEVDDDGTARMVITGDNVSIIGCAGRLSDLAAKARREGDPRSEGELRSDIARALLLHGVLPLPDLGDEPSLVTPYDIERLVDVLTGTPAHEVQVVVPWDVLTGTAALIGPATINPAPADVPEKTRPAPGADAARTSDATARSETGAVDATAGDGAAPSGHRPGTALGVPGTAPPPGPPGPGRVGQVGQVLGRHGRYLSATEIRGILGRPGTTIYRLLTDPADGRCIERSTTAYAPDAAMRAQLRAADVTSRAPGSTTPASVCQLDHVTEYLVGGATSEPNLQTLDVPFHAIKTEKFWDAVMDATRNVTWTSFWGRTYRTRPHDYTQLYTWILGPVPGGLDPGGGSPDGESPDGESPSGCGGGELVDERYLASLLVYAALAQRPPGSRLEADDDDPDLDLDPESLAAIHRLRDVVVLRHTTSTGRKAPGPRPDTPTPEQLTTTDRQDILESIDWVQTVTDTTARTAQEATGDVDDGPPDDGPADGDPADDAPPPF